MPADTAALAVLLLAIAPGAAMLRGWARGRGHATIGSLAAWIVPACVLGSLWSSVGTLLFGSELQAQLEDGGGGRIVAVVITATLLYAAPYALGLLVGLLARSLGWRDRRVVAVLVDGTSVEGSCDLCAADPLCLTRVLVTDAQGRVQPAARMLVRQEQVQYVLELP